MNRPSYKQALQWIVDNDDTEWLRHEYGSLSVTAAFVADLFGVSDDRIKNDLLKKTEVA